MADDGGAKLVEQSVRHHEVGKRAPKTVAVDLDLGGLVDRFALETAKKVRALSKGNRQKVQLIAALAARADLLLLDEPTSGLDPLMEMAFRACVAEANKMAVTREYRKGWELPK